METGNESNRQQVDQRAENSPNGCSMHPENATHIGELQLYPN